MSRSFTLVLHTILSVIWVVALVTALPGIAISGLAARAGMWLSGERE